MSWLFDQLCALATADQVEVVIDIDRSTGPSLGDDAHDLVDVLQRAADVPQLTVVVTGGEGVVGDAPHAPVDVDLDDLRPELRRQAVVACLDTQLTRSAASELIVRGRSISVDAPDARLADPPTGVRRVVATDGTSGLDRLAALTGGDLGIAVGGVATTADITVDDLLGVTSIIDALVTLRQFSFGSQAA